MSWTDRGIRTDPLRYVDGCFTAQGKSTNSTASTTAIVISDLAGYGDDFFNDHYYMQVLKNADSAGAAPEGEVRQITDYVSATGTFTVTAFSATVAAEDECLILHESLVVIGRDDADNTFASTNVVANRDGSLLERTEFIISMITGGAADLRVSQSVAGTVEEGGFLQFTVGLMDIDTGAIASANIDITAITQTMERSRGGAAFSPMTAPVFAKADGQVYCSYEFLAAEWQTGDLYRMTLTGVKCTIGTQTAYVPAMIWSNVVVEAEDIKTAVEYLYAVADGGTTSPTKVLDNSILSILMTKDSGGDTSDFNNSTDSLEAQSDKLGGFSGDGGAQQDDSVKASLDLAHTDIDNIYIDTQAIAIVVSDIQTNLLPDLSADVSDLQTDLGDPSTRTNLKSIEAMLGNPDTADKTIYEAVKNIRETAINGSSLPVANTLSDILHKNSSYTYDNTTDSLEAISDAITEGSLQIEADAGSTASAIIDAAALTQATDDWWKGCLLVSINGDNSGQARPIVGFDEGTDKITVSPPFLAAPTAGDDFLVISGFKLPDWSPQPAVAINATVVTSPGVDVLDLVDTNNKTSYRLNNLRIKCADPGANTVTITLYELINGVSTAVDTFTITTDNYGTYFSLFDMFGLPQVSGDDITINATSSAGSYALTGNYQYDLSYNV